MKRKVLSQVTDNDNNSCPQLYYVVEWKRKPENVLENVKKRKGKLFKRECRVIQFNRLLKQRF